MIDNEISELFTSARYKNGEDIYDYTIVLSRLYLRDNNDGLLYPSIADNFKAVNLALVPSLVKEKLKAVECKLFKLINLHSNKPSKVQLLRDGIFKNDDCIIWSEKIMNQFYIYEK